MAPETGLFDPAVGGGYASVPKRIWGKERLLLLLIVLLRTRRQKLHTDDVTAQYLP